MDQRIVAGQHEGVNENAGLAALGHLLESLCDHQRVQAESVFVDAAVVWKMYAPHKVKMAVSGCPRNCAESGIKDVGVIGVESGWEIYVAGNGGIKTEVGQFFCKVKSAEEVLEYAGAFIQLYREEARYLDRTVHWVQRVGLDYVKQRVLEDHEGRKALYARLQYALQGEKDPWLERSEGAQRHEFEVLTV